MFFWGLNESFLQATEILALTGGTLIKSLLRLRRIIDNRLLVISVLSLLFMLGIQAFAGNFRNDVAIVRAILDSNHISAPISSVATERNGRIVALHFDETCWQTRQGRRGFTSGVLISKIPPIINGLDALDTLEISHFIVGEKLTLPAYVGGLSGLRSLSIRGADLDSIPNGFSKLVGLRIVALAGDNLVAFPQAITTLPELAEVDLSDNKIRSIPKTIGLMQRLTSFNVRNQETDTVFSIPPELAQDSLLSALDISYNDLADFPPPVLHIKHLSELHVESCRLSALPQEIEALRELTYLNASWNGLAGLPAGLSGLRSLSTLILVSNPLDSFPSVICDLPRLTYLNLQECNLTSLPSAIGALSSLQELNVCYNRISRVPPEIGNLKSVTTLRLQNNTLSQLPEEITKLTPKSWLSVMNNPLFDPSRVDFRISAWLCHYDVNWGNDFSVCNGQTSAMARSPDKKSQPVFTASGGIEHYTILSSAMVSLKLYDMQGRLLRILCNRMQSSGAYDIRLPEASANTMCALVLKIDGVEFTRVLSTVR